MDNEIVKTLTKEDKEILKQMYLFLSLRYLDSIQCSYDDIELKLIKLYSDKELYTLIKRHKKLAITNVGIYNYNPPEEPIFEKASYYKNYVEEVE